MNEIIKVTNLSKTFRTPFRRRRVEAVRSISFGVEPGEIFGFLGPNGAGKTTTIKMLTGLIQPGSGKIGMLGGVPEDIAVAVKMVLSARPETVFDEINLSPLKKVVRRKHRAPLP